MSNPLLDVALCQLTHARNVLLALASKDPAEDSDGCPYCEGTYQDHGKQCPWRAACDLVGLAHG